MTEKEILTPQEVIRMFSEQKESLASQLPEIIKEARIKSGLQLSELSARADVSRTYLWQLEGGSVSPPNVEILAKVFPHIDLQLVVRRITNGEELAATPGIEKRLERRIQLLQETLPADIRLVFEKINDR